MLKTKNKKQKGRRKWGKNVKTGKRWEWVEIRLQGGNIAQSERLGEINKTT